LPDEKPIPCFVEFGAIGLLPVSRRFTSCSPLVCLFQRYIGGLAPGDLFVFDLLNAKCAPTTIESFGVARFGAADFYSGTPGLPGFAVCASADWVAGTKSRARCFRRVMSGRRASYNNGFCEFVRAVIPERLGPCRLQPPNNSKNSEPAE
jgi:hypothetical protein